MWLFACASLSGSRLEAAVKPAAIFTDNAVLQRGISVPVWGTARDGEIVTVKINGQTAAATASGGKWLVRLKPMAAGGPFTMTISGENTVELKNLLIGEVWLCGGQSNMQWPLAETDHAEDLIAQSKDEGLRLFTVPLVTAPAPAQDLPGGKWDLCGPDPVRNFSAVGYHFGRELRRSLGVPIGLINDSYGGSIVQAWTSALYLESDPESKPGLAHKPDWAEGPQNGFGLLYNGMIAPIIPYALRGVIWYQGEGNTVSTEADHYRTSFPLLIRNWREDWGQGDFPFLFVQLAPWARDAKFHVAVDPEGTGWAVVREAQLLTSRRVKNTAMAVITDAGDPDRIHPRRKEPVGQRLALAARAVAYRQPVNFRGPSYKSMKIKGSKAVLSFYDVDGGLIVQGDAATGFGIAGVDRQFHPAQAKILGEGRIKVWSDRVAQPVAVRYGWANCPAVNVANRAGLPMSPFRTDHWPPEKPFKTYAFTSRTLEVETNAVAVTYTSPWLKVSFSLHQPTMTFLSVDSMGESRHKRNLLKEPIGCGPTVSTSGEASMARDMDCRVTVTGNGVRYTHIKLGDFETDALSFTVEPKAIKVEIERDIPKAYDATFSSPLRLMLDATVTPASPLGRLSELGKLRFPVLLHFPDWGSLLMRIQEQGSGESTLDFSLLRDGKPVKLGAVAAWGRMSPEYRARMEGVGNHRMLEANAMHLGPEQIQLALHKGRADGRQLPGRQHLELSFSVTSIYPEAAVVDADPRLIGIKRAWLNIFGFRADLACLANNSTGDTCQFCMFCYADQACHTPPLFDDFTALDLVRTALDRYFDGFKGFEDRFQDVAPSTIIAAWDYATSKPDQPWLQRRIGSLEKYADRMIAADVDGDGLCESDRDPTNWWDCTPWNWKDAYSSALSWRAFRCLADLEHRVGNEAAASRYRERADRIKAVYYSTFYNPDTGVLAGWRLKDGGFGDSYFLWVNGIAISYGLVDQAQANAILDRLQAKIKEVGFRSYRYGLPGNLVSFENKARLRFQYYENGAVTGSMAYHYLQALYSAGRKAEAEAIFEQMLEGYRDGTFQNGIGGGGDWKEWDGSPCGYEGLLVDAYYPLTAFITGRLARGIIIP